IGEAEARHDLPVVRLITGAIAANFGVRRGSGRNPGCVLYDSLGQIDVSGLVILLVPGLVVLVAEADVQREVRHDLPVVLNEPRSAPLPLSDEDALGSHLRLMNPVEHKVRAAITGGVAQQRVARVVAGVAELPEETSVV